MTSSASIFTAPADLKFSQLLANVKTVIRHGLYEDETSRSIGEDGKAQWVQWHVPAAHYLESWGDTVSNDGTLSVTQPMIAPLFGPQLSEAERKLAESDRPMQALSEIELLAMLAGDKRPDGFKIVRAVWRDMAKRSSPTEPEDGFERRFRRSLQDGVLQGQSAPTWVKDIQLGEIAKAVAGLKVPAGPTPGTLDVVFTAGHIGDGRYANVGWLQELPEMGTMVCWDNPALGKG